jgi:hypothetical protein
MHMQVVVLALIFCDQYTKYGIDTPLINAMERLGDTGQVFKIDNGYKETWEILKTL